MQEVFPNIPRELFNRTANMMPVFTVGGEKEEFFTIRSTGMNTMNNFEHVILTTKIAESSVTIPREPPIQLKRHRILQFDSEVPDSPPFHAEMFMRSKEIQDSLEDAISDMLEWVARFAEGSTESCNEYLDSASEWWNFNDTVMHFSAEDNNAPGAPDVQVHNGGILFGILLDQKPLPFHGPYLNNQGSHLADITISVEFTISIPDDEEGNAADPNNPGGGNPGGNPGGGNPDGDNPDNDDLIEDDPMDDPEYCFSKAAINGTMCFTWSEVYKV